MLPAARQQRWSHICDEFVKAEIDCLQKCKLPVCKEGIPVIFDEMVCLDKNNPEDRYAWCVAVYLRCEGKRHSLHLVG